MGTGGVMESVGAVIAGVGGVAGVFTGDTGGDTGGTVGSKFAGFERISDALFSNPSRENEPKNNLLNARETNITSNRKIMVDDFPTGVPKMLAI